MAWNSWHHRRDMVVALLLAPESRELFLSVVNEMVLLEGIELSTSPLPKTQLPPASIEIARFSVAKIASSYDLFSGFRGQWHRKQHWGSSVARRRGSPLGVANGEAPRRCNSEVSHDNGPGSAARGRSRSPVRHRSAGLASVTQREAHGLVAALHHRIRSGRHIGASAHVRRPTAPRRKVRLHAAPADEPVRPAA